MKDINDINAYYQGMLSGKGTAADPYAYNLEKAVKTLFGEAGATIGDRVLEKNSLIDLINKAANGEDVLDRLTESLIAIMVLSLGAGDGPSIEAALKDKLAVGVIGNITAIDNTAWIDRNSVFLHINEFDQQADGTASTWPDTFSLRKDRPSLLLHVNDSMYGGINQKTQMIVTLAGRRRVYLRKYSETQSRWGAWELIGAGSELAAADICRTEKYTVKRLQATKQPTGAAGQRYYKVTETGPTASANVDWGRAYTRAAEHIVNGGNTFVDYIRQTPLTYTGGDLYEVELADVDEAEVGTGAGQDAAYVITSEDTGRSVSYILDNYAAQTGHNRIPLADYYAAAYDKFSVAAGEGAVVTGKNTLATGAHSFAAGEGCVAIGENQTVIGQYNRPADGYLLVVGDGTDDEHRHNTFTVDQAGNAWRSATEADARIMGFITGGRLLTEDCNRNTATDNGVTFEWENDETLDIHRVNGTGVAWYRLLGSADGMPWWLVPGKTYLVKCAVAKLDEYADNESDHIGIQFRFNNTANTRSAFYRNGYLSVPQDAAGVEIYAFVNSSAPENVHARMTFAVVPEIRFPGDVYSAEGRLVTEETATSVLTGRLRKINTTLTEGSINAMTGAANIHSTLWEKTDFIDVRGHRYLRYISAKTAGNVDYGMAFYDSGKNYVSGTPFSIVTNNGTYTEWITAEIPDNAAWARLTCWNAEKRAVLDIPPFEAYFADDYTESLEKHVKDISFFFSGTPVAAYVGSLSAGNVNADSGAVADNSSYYVKTQPIDVAGHSYIRYFAPRLTASLPYGAAFYDESNGYISGVRNPADAESTAGYEIVTAKVPANAKYVRATYWNSERQAALSAPAFALYYVEDYEESVEKKFKDQIQSVLTGHLVPVVHGAMTAGTILSSSGKEKTASSYYLVTPPVDVSGHVYIRFPRPRTQNKAYDYGYAFFTEGYVDSGATADNDHVHEFYLTGEPNPVVYDDSPRYEETTVKIPENAKWLRVTYWNETSRAALNAPVFSAAFADDYENSLEGKIELGSIGTGLNDLNAEALRMGLHCIPTSTGQLNIVKRARQLTDVRWTPAVDLPRMDLRGQYFLGVFKAGTEYRGIPYVKTMDTDGSAGDPYPCASYGLTHFYVGLAGKPDFNGHGEGGVAVETFVTAAQNPRSYLCREYTANADTDFLNSYHYGVHYGIVCSALASYAFDLSKVKTVSNITDNDFRVIGGGKTVAELKTAVQTKLIEVGNLLNLREVGGTNHSMIVTDLIRDETGEISSIEISEATPVGNPNMNDPGGPFGGLCRRAWRSTDDFVSVYGDYKVYERLDIDNVPYSPDNFAGEEGMTWQRNDKLQVMPYEGNGFRYITEDAAGGRRVVTPYGGIRLLIDNDHRNPIFTPGNKEAAYAAENSFHYDWLTIEKPDGSTEDIPVDENTTEYVLFDGVQTDFQTGIYKAHLWKIVGEKTRTTLACRFEIIN